MVEHTWELVSADRRHKAVITLRQDRLYGVALYAWTHEVVEGYGDVETFWAEVESPALTDTFANAVKLAEEGLRRSSRGTPPA